jgi:thymidylate synthase
MNTLDKQYTDLLQDILDNGVTKSDRTGTGTISVFGRQIRHKMSEGFPLLTTKKMAWKTMVTELLWFLRGDTNIKFLVDNDCHIWDGDAYKRFLNETIKIEPIDAKQRAIEQLLNSKESKEEFINKIKTDDEFAKKWGSLGPVYGKQWRSWEINEPKNIVKTENVTWPYEPNPHTYQQRVGSFKITQIDQIANLINDLKTNPDSRRLMVNAWNVGELDSMVLPPCHYGFQVYTRELSLEERVRYYETTFGRLHFIPPSPDALDTRNIPTRAISLMWNQRSVDTPLGLPFNIASYGLLLEIIAKTVNMVPDELIGNLGDCHIYLNQIDGVKEQIGKIPWEERKEMLTDPIDIREFGNITPFTEPVIHHWLNYKNIPYSRRMPYPLPTLKHMKTDDFYKSLSEDLSLFTHLDNTDFVVENYQSHPTIKMPLSN